MGNAIDCNRCSNFGWKRDAGCPECKRVDKRHREDAEYDRLMLQYEISKKERNAN